MTAFYKVQPITDFSIFTTPAAQRKGSQFKASWTDTVEQLERELDHLRATDVVMEIAVSARDIRKDGMLRADARPSHPGVRISFQSASGSLSFTCDTYEQTYAWVGLPSWQANARAIVKTLEALRAVDRYGATKGEQYAGFKALGAGTGGIALGGMTRDEAIYLLDEYADRDWALAQDGPRVYRLARAGAHPDRNGGDRSAWDRVEQAAKVLGLSS
jgi:hypothetical protein